jgi:hypothetical protein
MSLVHALYDSLIHIVFFKWQHSPFVCYIYEDTSRNTFRGKTRLFYSRIVRLCLLAELAAL